VPIGVIELELEQVVSHGAIHEPRLEYDVEDS
jgi:hypothetical protein